MTKHDSHLTPSIYIVSNECVSGSFCVLFDSHRFCVCAPYTRANAILNRMGNIESVWFDVKICNDRLCGRVFFHRYRHRRLLHLFMNALLQMETLKSHTDHFSSLRKTYVHLDENFWAKVLLSLDIHYNLIHLWTTREKMTCNEGTFAWQLPMFNSYKKANNTPGQFEPFKCVNSCETNNCNRVSDYVAD